MSHELEDLNESVIDLKHASTEIQKIIDVLGDNNRYHKLPVKNILAVVEFKHTKRIIDEMLHNAEKLRLFTMNKNTKRMMEDDN